MRQLAGATVEFTISQPLLLEYQCRLIGSFPRLRFKQIDDRLFSRVGYGGVVKIDDEGLKLTLGQRGGGRCHGYALDSYPSSAYAGRPVRHFRDERVSVSGKSTRPRRVFGSPNTLELFLLEGEDIGEDMSNFPSVGSAAGRN